MEADSHREAAPSRAISPLPPPEHGRLSSGSQREHPEGEAMHQTPHVSEMASETTGSEG